jgi:hypothetical protein
LFYTKEDIVGSYRHKTGTCWYLSVAAQAGKKLTKETSRS